MSFVKNIFDAVYNNLIAGDAYYLIAKSVFVTLGMVVAAWLISFFLGAFVSYFMCYEKKIISRIFEAVCFIFRSTPALLMMLLFYYVFCKKNFLGPTLTAGVSLGLYGAGHFAEILTRSVRDAQKRQDTEVTKRLKHVFYSIALPQAMEEAIFPMKRLAVHLLQWTAVAGYITVNDLTEVMNRIGQRTMYPFFSIFFCILFYFIVTIIIEVIFSRLDRKFSSTSETKNTDLSYQDTQKKDKKSRDQKEEKKKKHKIQEVKRKEPEKNKFTWFPDDENQEDVEDENMEDEDS